MEREDYISDEMVVKRVNEAVKMEIRKKKALGVPVYVYNRKTKKIYQKNSDGTQEVIERMWKGRYSERIAKKA